MYRYDTKLGSNLTEVVTPSPTRSPVESLTQPRPTPPTLPVPLPPPRWRGVRTPVPVLLLEDFYNGNVTAPRSPLLSRYPDTGTPGTVVPLSIPGTPPPVPTRLPDPAPPSLPRSLYSASPSPPGPPGSSSPSGHGGSRSYRVRVEEHTPVPSEGLTVNLLTR